MGLSPLRFTTKSIIRCSDVDSDMCVTRTSSLSYDESLTCETAAFESCASNFWFLRVSSSTWAFKDVKYSLVRVRIDALSFYIIDPKSN